MSGLEIRAVLKFPINVSNQETWSIKMPIGANILHVGSQDTSPNRLAIWAECFGTIHGEDETFTKHMVTREFIIVGTGYPMPMESLKHIGTVILKEHFLVWHVWERIPA